MKFVGRDSMREGPGVPGWVPSRGVAAFTLVEISLCLGIIAFALVAIVGVLPTGFQMSKENNYNALMEREAGFLLRAISTGGAGVDYLTNNFDYIKIKSTGQRNGTPVTGIVILTNSPGLEVWLAPNVLLLGALTNGPVIASALRRRVYNGLGEGRYTNLVTARVRQIVGSPFDGSLRGTDTEFIYQLTSGVLPLDSYSQDSIDYLATGISEQEKQGRSNFWASVASRHRNTSQMLLTLQGRIHQKGNETFEFTPVYRYAGPPKTFRLPRINDTFALAETAPTPNFP
jgi:hypothetical protein